VLGAQLDSGFEVVAETVGLEEALEGASLAITGEGRIDQTSFGGKVVGGVLDWATDAGVPAVSIIAGQVGPGVAEELSLFPAARLYALTDRVWQSGETFARAATLVEEAAYEAALASLIDG
jgi:glycerate 2-kinase